MQTADWLKNQFTTQNNRLTSTHQATARRNETHAAEMKAQFAELKLQMRDLQNTLQKLPQRIKEREESVMDEEETKLLDDMQDMHTASVKLQRRATMRLQALTTLIEDAPTPVLVPKRKPPPVPPRKKIFMRNNDRTSPNSISNSQRVQTQSPVISPIFALPNPSTKEISASSSGDASRTKQQPRSDIWPGRSPGSASSSTTSLASHEVSSSGLSQQSTAQDTGSNPASQPYAPAISSQEFDVAFESVLVSAQERRIGADKPFSDDVISRIGDLLRSAGKPTWSERPRTYIVLRMIDEVKAMNDFIFEGYKDIHLPYTEHTLPSSLRSPSSRYNFLREQRHVLSPRSADLVQGGRHHHLGKLNLHTSACNADDDQTRGRTPTL